MESLRIPRGFRRVLFRTLNTGRRLVVGGYCIVGSHSSTIDILHAWEKKLFQEVKNAESIKMEHEKKVEQVRRLEMKRAEYVKTEKAKKDVDKLESQLIVSSQAIQSASNEIIKLRETELYPQLVELVKGQQEQQTGFKIMTRHTLERAIWVLVRSHSRCFLKCK